MKELFHSLRKVWCLALTATALVFGCLSLHADPTNIVVLGDSLSAGYGVELSQAWPTKLQEHIDAAALNYKVVNAGVSGDTTSGGLSRLDWILKRPVGWLVLELGGNDGLRGIPLETTRSNLCSIIEKTRAKWPQAQVLVAGMQIPGNMGESYTTQFRDLFPWLAGKYHATLIPFLLQGVGGHPDLNQADQIHPNPTGHQLVASNVWNVLQPLLAKVPNASDSPK